MNDEELRKLAVEESLKDCNFNCLFVKSCDKKKSDSCHMAYVRGFEKAYKLLNNGMETGT